MKEILKLDDFCKYTLIDDRLIHKSHKIYLNKKELELVLFKNIKSHKQLILDLIAIFQEKKCDLNPATIQSTLLPLSNNIYYQLCSENALKRILDNDSLTNNDMRMLFLTYNMTFCNNVNIMFGNVARYSDPKYKSNFQSGVFAVNDTLNDYADDYAQYKENSPVFTKHQTIGLYGLFVPISHQQNVELSDENKDFSVMHREFNGVNTPGLLIGPIQFVNHQCVRPNVDIVFNSDTKLTYLKAVRDIKNGEELLTYYGDNYFGETNQYCQCKVCEKKELELEPIFKSSEILRLYRNYSSYFHPNKDELSAYKSTWKDMSDQMYIGFHEMTSYAEIAEFLHHTNQLLLPNYQCYEKIVTDKHQTENNESRLYMEDLKNKIHALQPELKLFDNNNELLPIQQNLLMSKEVKHYYKYLTYYCARIGYTAPYSQVLKELRVDKTTIFWFECPVRGKIDKEGYELKGASLPYHANIVMFDWKKETNTIAITIYEADPNYGSTKQLSFRSLTPWALNKTISDIISKKHKNKSYTIDLVCNFQKDSDKRRNCCKNFIINESYSSKYRIASRNIEPKPKKVSRIRDDHISEALNYKKFKTEK
eukprot:NODE_214_length_12495_cov_0.543078.p2 type:complete len:594 gc:universal NODE_214_length_12495_cov_0.543078:5975-7756(+)